ncbi:MAG: nitrilase-related carbon-nitrogen hydrolase, partial [Stellaceae bacterium]
RYDKIHMFDVDLPGGESYRESSAYRPGNRAVVAATPWGRLGLSVCYDLRFPHLYRALAQGGADFLAVPAAFTVPTGRAHWHVLLRARAIENGCFVLAPAQEGEHAEGRRTYGHSLIVAPWGEVLAEAQEGVGFITAEIDPGRIEEARRAVPSLRHDRPFERPAKAPLAAE